jgi:sugar (pentulose or hexulose) kinase
MYKVQTAETSGLGAAMCGFVGMGVYADFQEASKHMIRVSREFVPDEKRKKIYATLYDQAYTKLYRRLKPIYLAMESIENIDNV